MPTQILRDVILQLSKDRQELQRRLDERPHKRPRLDNATSASSVDPISGPSTPRKKHSDSNTPQDDDDLVQCPICQTFVLMDVINSHMDNNCAALKPPDSKPRSKSGSKTKQKAAWSQLMSGAQQGKGKDRDLSELEDRLPKQSYDMLNDKQVRHLLQEHDLSTIGDRKTLIARHKRWVITYNANLDRAPKRRQTLATLRADLKKWESEHKGTTSKPVSAVSDSEAHQRTHKTQFAALVAAARQTKTAKDRGPPQSPSPMSRSSSAVSENKPRESSATPEPIDGVIELE
ncbi:hypothetical protein PUNSTDRAFT_69405 [Punctularia strigosozonata HHB-11173 SS5]|uniref:uncharacterized protein n=1 Tax=Punctularia strigosozonata (strain HHB-11173) TaxID=741275 RepID=UPI00044181CD|nr:uncharacterized protein PUNSTDRAFT_69405 [Punctularia strigosozonata HHB-11173 SS5]EIN08006.1 hypothetical protein PUNSTDRAFT_69405 [Punctularia strigosozonata HHB-11173 SS5]